MERKKAIKTRLHTQHKLLQVDQKKLVTEGPINARVALMRLKKKEKQKTAQDQ